jgi:hypothetical protein
MNLFNRLILILITLASVTFWGAVILLVLVWPNEAMDYVSGWIAYFKGGNVWQFSMGVVIVAVIFGLLAFALLLLEISPRRRSAVQITQVQGGTGLLTTEAIVQRLKRDVEVIPQVQQVKPEVTSRGKSVDIHADLQTDPAVDVAPKTEEVIGVIRSIVEKGMGVKLRNLQVNIRHGRHPAGRPSTPPRTASTTEGTVTEPDGVRADPPEKGAEEA